MKAFQHMMDSSVAESISSLEKHSNESGKFDNVIDILKRVGGKKLYEIIKDELIYDKTDVWNIICHGKYFLIFLNFFLFHFEKFCSFMNSFLSCNSTGDLWVNNLMFLKENNTVKSAVFVDLQVFRYGHLINDILSFIYCTTSAQLRKTHLNQMLSVYHEALMDCLKRTLSDIDKFQELEREFSLHNIKTKFHSHALFGMGSSLIITSAVVRTTFLFILIESVKSSNLVTLFFDRHMIR